MAAFTLGFTNRWTSLKLGTHTGTFKNPPHRQQEEPGTASAGRAADVATSGRKLMVTTRVRTERGVYMLFGRPPLGSLYGWLHTSLSYLGLQEPVYYGGTRLLSFLVVVFTFLMVLAQEARRNGYICACVDQSRLKGEYSTVGSPHTTRKHYGTGFGLRYG